MTYTDAIEQAIERQLEIERKAAAWDALVKETQTTSALHVAVSDLVGLMSRLLGGPGHA
jgi:hypothetical protein